MALIENTPKGLYCAAGDFYIDPWRPVDFAIITHAHSDHARWGSSQYLCHAATKPLLQLRLGEGMYNTVAWGEKVHRNGVEISLHPAGHIIGSSQVRVCYKGEIWVVSGDYKLQDDGISGAYEPIACHTFITECTFGLPIYQWQPQEQVYEDMRQWVIQTQQSGKTPVLFAYSLGKAQRVLQALQPLQPKVLVHGAIANVQTVLEAQGYDFLPVTKVHAGIGKKDIDNAVVIAPPGADGTSWMKRFAPYRTGVCSGWMQVRGHVRRRNADKGFVLSDHVDWPSLLKAIRATGADKVITTHGFQAAFARYLREEGWDATELSTPYGTEEEEVLLTENSSTI